MLSSGMVNRIALGDFFSQRLQAVILFILNVYHQIE
jgi:hypothetical protein